MIRYDALDALPVRDALPGLTGALDAHGTAVLVAPPGTGKTTLVPLALAGLLGAGLFYAKWLPKLVAGPGQLPGS
ncbi:hypothetical protein, partial [Streptomyces sp. NPDC004976]